MKRENMGALHKWKASQLFVRTPVCRFSFIFKKVSMVIRTAKNQYTTNLKKLFPGKELRGHSPNFHIHVSVSDLYIPTMDLCLFCCRKYMDRSWKYINRSQTQEYGIQPTKKFFVLFLLYHHILGIACKIQRNTLTKISITFQL